MMTHVTTPARGALCRLLGAILLTCGLLGLATPAAFAGVANRGVPGASPSNPLAGLPWGVYTGSADNSTYPFYARAAPAQKRLLARIALRPQMFSFGAWFADSDAGNVARGFIGNVTAGNPNVLSQVAVFRMDPWEGSACPGHWSAANQASYRHWIDSFAAGIGASRVALVLQPDMPFAVCAGTSAPYHMVSYAARKFSALPHTTVYIDAGARYWPAFSQVVPMLAQAGIRYARGFALNTTEYDATGAELEYGARVSRALAAAGLPGKHFVINTAENGAPFLNGQYHGDITNPRVCTSPRDHLCATLGMPPTSDTANPRWHLSGADRAIAARYADAYVWVGRPWLPQGSGPFDLHRALGLALSTPF